MRPSRFFAFIFLAYQMALEYMILSPHDRNKNRTLSCVDAQAEYTVYCIAPWLLIGYAWPTRATRGEREGFLQGMSVQRLSYSSCKPLFLVSFVSPHHQALVFFILVVMVIINS